MSNLKSIMLLLTMFLSMMDVSCMRNDESFGFHKDMDTTVKDPYSNFSLKSA